jgi:shikimate kinase / 3-dehydroquinate synthase
MLKADTSCGRIVRLQRFVAMFGKPNIYLVGPMGSGKTAVGRQLARMLGVPFHDSDAEIERRTGVDVPFIFEREGEPGFRQREREALEALVQLSPIVMATGGGAVLAPENRRLLSDHGVVVFLETSVGQQLQRVGSGRGRPLLQQQEDLPALLRRMRAIRDPLYREVAKVAESILRQIERRRPPYTPSTVLKLDVPLGDRAYPILIGESLLGDSAVLDAHIRARDVLLVSNTTIAPLYAERVRAALGDRRVVEVRLPDGEQYKTLEYVTRILDCLVANRFARDGLLLALGGGVVGDMVGFAAACYQRGVDFAQAPTSRRSSSTASCSTSPSSAGSRPTLTTCCVSTPPLSPTRSTGPAS